jgi:hypothetical protein
MGTGSFLGVKWPERGVDHPHPSSAEVKEIIGLYLYSLNGPSVACSRANFNFKWEIHVRLCKESVRLK